MKTIIVVILVLGFITSIIYYNRRINRLKLEIDSSIIGINSLKKEVADVNYNYGFSLAKAKCWTCHRFNFASYNLLDGVVERVGERYLTLFLTKQDSLIIANDPYAVSLKKKFGNMGNRLNFKFLPSELKAVIAFIK